MNKAASLLENKKKFLILGCGFSGSFFAKTIRELGFNALTSSRSEKKDPYSFVFNSENGIVPSDKIFNNVTHILSCIPPDKNGNDPVLVSLKSQLQNLPLEWVGYLSTTGVYGNTEGDWVSELDQPNPFQKRSQNRLNCERKWIDSGLPFKFLGYLAFMDLEDQLSKQLEIKKIRIISKKSSIFKNTCC